MGMTDREKVIKGLGHCPQLPFDLCFTECTIYDCPYKSDDLGIKSLHEDAVSLLKEQESVKPVQHLVYTTRGWFCGACDGRLNRLGKYCSFCGRPVKWDND